MKWSFITDSDRAVVSRQKIPDQMQLLPLLHMNKWLTQKIFCMLVEISLQ